MICERSRLHRGLGDPPTVDHPRIGGSTGATELPFHEVCVWEHGEQASPIRCDGSIEQHSLHNDRELMGMLL